MTFRHISSGPRDPTLSWKVTTGWEDINRREMGLSFATHIEAVDYVSHMQRRDATLKLKCEESPFPPNAKWNGEENKAVKIISEEERRWKDRMHSAYVTADRDTKGDRGNRLIIERGWDRSKVPGSTDLGKFLEYSKAEHETGRQPLSLKEWRKFSSED